MLVTTPGSPVANSYLTAAEAVEYLTLGRAYSESFTNLATSDQEVFLAWATSLLDSTFDYPGSIFSIPQRLRWPRIGVLDADHRYIDQATIPPEVKHATAVLALELSKRDRSEVPDIITQGLQSLTIGPISFTVDERARLALVPDFVMAVLGVFGTPKGAALGPYGGRAVKLLRS